MSRFPWAQIMALGLGRLRLAPTAFWAMTPREFTAALGLGTQTAVMTRADLDALLRMTAEETISDD